MRTFICVIIALAISVPTHCLSATVEVHIKGIDDGVRTSKQQDYREAVLFAKREAIERAGIQMKSITTVNDLMVQSDYIESKAEAVLTPGYTIMDIGYQRDGTYLVILIGKVKSGPVKRVESKAKVIDGDERFDVYDNGVIKDRLTGNEWYVGPDVHFTWYEAQSWVEGLKVDGGGWRLPTILELKTLYKFQGLSTHLPKVFRNKTNKDVVWSAESASPAIAKAYRYDYDNGYVKSEKKSKEWFGTGFAIRAQN